MRIFCRRWTGCLRLCEIAFISISEPSFTFGELRIIAIVSNFASVISEDVLWIGPLEPWSFRELVSCLSGRGIGLMVSDRVGGDDREFLHLVTYC